MITTAKLFAILQLPQLRALPVKTRLALVGVVEVFNRTGERTSMTHRMIRAAQGVELGEQAWSALFGVLTALGAASEQDGLVMLNPAFFMKGQVRSARRNSGLSKCQRLARSIYALAAQTFTKPSAQAAPLRVTISKEIGIITVAQRCSLKECKERWSDAEIDEASAILSERKVLPRNPSAVMRAGLLAEVRAGRRSVQQQAMTFLATTPPREVKAVPFQGFNEDRAKRAMGLPCDFQPVRNARDALDALTVGLQRSRAAQAV